MSRSVLDTAAVAPDALQKISAFQEDVVKTVKEAVAKERVVVVGMAQNLFVKKARKALDQQSIPYRYIEYGSYFSQWQKRLAIKLWSGWPTFPQVFVNGVLIGGANDTLRAIENGSLKKNG
ncbi:MAG: glutaredoxin [Chitinophagaceae bacterium]|nr:glutaredoxin [Oligoflexus sp.]